MSKGCGHDAALCLVASFRYLVYYGAWFDFALLRSATLTMTTEVIERAPGAHPTCFLKTG